MTSEDGVLELSTGGPLPRPPRHAARSTGPSAQPGRRLRSEYLSGHRIACLSTDGLAALFHRLAVNSSRLDRISEHFAPEAERLSTEMDLWELWVGARDTEDGFQEWLDEEFSGQPIEDEHGQLVAGSAERTGTPRREVLRWNYEEIETELEQLLSRS